MTSDQLRLACTAQPFQPFMLHLSDGRQIPVQHREFITAAPSGRTIVVWQPDDTMNIIDVHHVTGLEIKPAKNGGTSNGGKKRKG